MHRLNIRYSQKVFAERLTERQPTNSWKSIQPVPHNSPKTFSGGHPKSLFTPGLKCFSLWPAILVFRGHLLVFNSYNTISMLCFYVTPPSGISSIKAILVCPGYFQMALGVLLSSPSASLALSPFTFSCFSFFPPHESAVGRSLLSRVHSLFIRKYKSFKEHFMRELFHKWDS